MRVTIQRVSEASVTIEGEIKSSIGQGLLVLAGFEEADTTEDLEWMCGKIVNLRIFQDENGQMNLSVKDISGEVILVSQFTLHALTKKGNRPSFIRAAKPDGIAMVGLERSHDILIDETGIHHGHDLQGFSVSDPAAIYQLLFNAHFFRQPGGQLATSMDQYLFFFNGGKVAQEGREFGFIIYDVAPDLYDV